MVEVAEQNADVGAAATVSISAVPGAGKAVTVPAGEAATVEFPDIVFDAPLPVPITAHVLNAHPAEDATANNERSATVEITNHALPTEPVILFPSLLGYGAQFNNHLYAPISQKQIPPDEYTNLEAKVKQLEPQLVRIFYNDNWEENYDGAHSDWQRRTTTRSSTSCS